MPISDATREEARVLAKRYPVARSSLLPMLHLVQSDEGYVSEDGIAMCAEVLGLTKAEVGAVATFYTMYKREPFGDYLLSVCTNPTCKIAGAQDIYESYVEACGGHIDLDGSGVMVEHAECLGICDAAPVVTINYENYGPVSPEQAKDLLAKARAGDPPASNWSGEVPQSIRQVHREFSGIDDGVNEQLIEAARLQTMAAVPPQWRSGETDIPVTHPGGDPAGHGGERFRSDARLSGDTGSERPESVGAQGHEEVLEDVAESLSGSEGELADQVISDKPAGDTPAAKDQPVVAGDSTSAEAEKRGATGSEQDPQDSTAGEGGAEELAEPVSERDTPSQDDSVPAADPDGDPDPDPTHPNPDPTHPNPDPTHPKGA
jgi:NADH-quinone oxidoreductase subunit E